MSPKDKILTRKIKNQFKLIQENIEAMQRDVHGLEYNEWKIEVDGLWSDILGHINQMSPETQHRSLNMIRESWTTYITHYNPLNTNNEI